MERREEFEEDDDKWVHDSSIDHRGKIPLRASTGVWKASFFIIAYEFAEKLCVFGLNVNLIIYLTKVLHQDIKTAAKNVNLWGGLTTMTPLIGGFVADAYLGRFSMVLVSSVIYLAGLFLLVMSQLVPSLKPCDPDACHKSLKLHKVVFYVALFTISLASGGYKPGLQSFGADQFDDRQNDERKKKMSFFNWWNFGLCSGMLLGVTVIAYIEDNVSWVAAYSSLAVIMAVSFLIFLSGRQFYRYRSPEGSPLTPMLQVLVAAAAKRHLPHPSNARHLYEVPESQKSERRLLPHTNRFRFLDKAAIIEQWDSRTTFEAENLNRWKLATVTQVEELKLIFSVIPIWLSSLGFNIAFVEMSFFVKQGSIMNRTIFSNFKIPAASLFCLVAISMIITVIFYDKILEPFIRQARKNERGISILQRIGIGAVFTIMGMVVAGFVERKRLKVAEMEQSNVVSMHIYWLIPQFMMLGLADGFTLVGLQEYFYDQVPDRMRSLGMALYFGEVGIANFLGSILITVVDTVTKRGGTGWFAKDLNHSRLDCFYWLLAAIIAVNLCVYVSVASKYSYKSVVVQDNRNGTKKTSEKEYDDNNVRV